MTQIEEQYISRLRAGDDKAYRMLYQQHYDVMCRVAYRYVQDADVAETLVQDCIIHQIKNVSLHRVINISH